MFKVQTSKVKEFKVQTSKVKEVQCSNLNVQRIKIINVISEIRRLVLLCNNDKKNAIRL